MFMTHVSVISCTYNWQKQTQRKKLQFKRGCFVDMSNMTRHPAFLKVAGTRYIYNEKECTFKPGNNYKSNRAKAKTSAVPCNEMYNYYVYL